METPKKIYIDDPTGEFDNHWSIDKNSNSIEYTRTDASIKKACDWLESVNLDFYQIREGVFSRQLVEDFKKYMEEE